jgi:hypothetical protein
MALRQACKELLCNHTHRWVFARVTHVKHAPEGHFYGFAEDVDDCGSTLWFKQKTETATLMLGPVLCRSDVSAPPAKGELLVGRVVKESVSHKIRFLWWFRHAAPLQRLVQVAKAESTEDTAQLCADTHYSPDLTLDNLWCLIRIFEFSDLASFARQYLPDADRAEHPQRKEKGPRGFILDRPVYRFVLDVSIFFGKPQICHSFAKALQDLCVVHPKHVQRIVEQETAYLEAQVDITNGSVRDLWYY